MSKYDKSSYYIEKYNLSTDKKSKEERSELWKEVANSEEARLAHAEHLGKQVTSEIAAITEAGKNKDYAALIELAQTNTITRTIIYDILKENIAGQVFETNYLDPWEQAFYKVKRHNEVRIINNTPTMGSNYVVQVAKQNEILPILTNDNRASYSYSTRNAQIGKVDERDEAATEIRRAILENRERQFISLIRNATTVSGGQGTANDIPLANMAMANETIPDINNVVFDTLANGLTKRNLSELIFKLEQYGYSGRTLYLSPRRKADIRSWLSTQASTSASPIDFFSQREILTSGKLEGLYNLEVKTLNYLRDNEVYVWDNSADFGEIFLRGETQVEDRISTEGAFQRELHAAQIEGQVLYNARRLAKLELR